MRRLGIIIILALVSLAPAVRAADISVESALDRNKGYIGDRIKYSLRIKADTLLAVDDVALTGSVGDFDILSWQPAGERIDGGQKIIDYSGMITTYQTGKVVIPPLPVRYRTPEGTADSILTDSITVYIMSLVMDDSTADVRSLKDVKSLGVGYAWLYYLIPAVVALAGVILFLVLRKKAVIEEAEKIPLKSPWIAARDRLLALRNSALEPKPYYIELSEIIREYLQRRYGFSALEMTTYEIRTEMDSISLSEDLHERLLTLLNNADLAKFAKYIPEKEFMETDFQRGWSFVEATTPPRRLSDEPAKAEVTA
jgi:hypothetical protein